MCFSMAATDNYKSDSGDILLHSNKKAYIYIYIFFLSIIIFQNLITDTFQTKHVKMYNAISFVFTVSFH